MQAARHPLAPVFDTVCGLCDNTVMNSLTSFSQPKIPPQDIQASPEGVDPAALIAARKAAVARNRRQAARISLLQDVLRIIGVLALIAGIAWFSHLKHRQHMEEERQKAERERVAQVAREKEREAEAARQEARRKVQMEAKRIADEEARRREEERLRKEEESRLQQANIKRYQSALGRFKGAVLNMLSAAPPSDLPAKVMHETWFSCIVPGGRDGLMLFEILATPGQSLRVSRLNAEGKVEDVSLEDFNRHVAKNSYLLSKGSYCYYNPANGRRWELRVPVLAEGETLDPSREDFRDLYNTVRQLGLATSEFTYNVCFRDFGGGETRLLSIPFGGTVTRSAVQRSLQSAANPQRRQDDNALRTRMEQGSLIIRRGGTRR